MNACIYNTITVPKNNIASMGACPPANVICTTSGFSLYKYHTMDVTIDIGWAISWAHSDNITIHNIVCSASEIVYVNKST